MGLQIRSCSINISCKLLPPALLSPWGYILTTSQHRQTARKPVTEWALVWAHSLRSARPWALGWPHCKQDISFPPPAWQGHAGAFSQQSPKLIASPSSLPSQQKMNTVGFSFVPPCCFASVPLLHWLLLLQPYKWKRAQWELHWPPGWVYDSWQLIKMNTFSPPVQTYHTHRQTCFKGKAQHFLKKNTQSLTDFHELSAAPWTEQGGLDAKAISPHAGHLSFAGWEPGGNTMILGDSKTGTEEGITLKQHAAFIHTSGTDFIQMGRKSSWPQALTSINAGFPVHMAVPFKELWQWYCL